MFYRRMNVNGLCSDVVEGGESAIESVKARAIALCDEHPIYKDVVTL